MAYQYELSSVKRMPRYVGDTSTISGLCDEVARAKFGGKLDLSAFQNYSANSQIKIWPIDPVTADEVDTNQWEIGMESMPLIPGYGIEFVNNETQYGDTSSVSITVTAGGGGATYNGISPIDVNNTTHQISAKGVPFGVQSPLFFVQDDNEAVVIGCSASGGGTTYTGDAQGALDEVYSNSGVWLTAHNTYTGDAPIYVNNETNHISISGEELSAGPNIDIFSSGGYVVISATGGGGTYTGDAQGALDEVYTNSGLWLTAHQSLADYQTTAAMSGYQTKLSSVNNIVYTASLPVSPDANTLYLIPEA